MQFQKLICLNAIVALGLSTLAYGEDVPAEISHEVNYDHDISVNAKDISSVRWRWKGDHPPKRMDWEDYKKEMEMAKKRSARVAKEGNDVADKTEDDIQKAPEGAYLDGRTVAINVNNFGEEYSLTPVDPDFQKDESPQEGVVTGLYDIIYDPNLQHLASPDYDEHLAKLRACNFGDSDKWTIGGVYKLDGKKNKSKAAIALLKPNKPQTIHDCCKRAGGTWKKGDGGWGKTEGELMGVGGMTGLAVGAPIGAAVGGGVAGAIGAETTVADSVFIAVGTPIGAGIGGAVGMATGMAAGYGIYLTIHTNEGKHYCDFST